MIIRGATAIVILVLLGLSLGLNFLGFGYAAAQRTRGPVPVDLARLVDVGLRTYPADIRRAIGEDLVANRDAVRDALVDFRMAQTRMYRAMQAEPFDAATLDEAFAEVRRASAALQTLGQEALGRAVAAARPQDRAAIRQPGPMVVVR